MKPAAREADNDPLYWELIAPTGVVLEFGPGVRWQLNQEALVVAAGMSAGTLGAMERGHTYSRWDTAKRSPAPRAPRWWSWRGWQRS